jgi:hypothetical protein
MTHFVKLESNWNIKQVYWQVKYVSKIIPLLILLIGKWILNSQQKTHSRSQHV